jgi:hypothetical protein
VKIAPYNPKLNSKASQLKNLYKFREPIRMNTIGNMELNYRVNQLNLQLSWRREISNQTRYR